MSSVQVRPQILILILLLLSGCTSLHNVSRSQYPLRSGHLDEVSGFVLADGEIIRFNYYSVYRDSVVMYIRPWWGNYRSRTVAQADIEQIKVRKFSLIKTVLAGAMVTAGVAGLLFVGALQSLPY